MKKNLDQQLFKKDGVYFNFQFQKDRIKNSREGSSRNLADHISMYKKQRQTDRGEGERQR